jgi:hypothetical protein
MAGCKQALAPYKLVILLSGALLSGAKPVQDRGS